MEKCKIIYNEVSEYIREYSSVTFPFETEFQDTVDMGSQLKVVAP
jgi:hypothetical protein